MVELLRRHVAAAHAVEGDAGELAQLLEGRVHFFLGSGLYSMVSVMSPPAAGGLAAGVNSSGASSAGLGGARSRLAGGSRRRGLGRVRCRRAGGRGRRRARLPRRRRVGQALHHLGLLLLLGLLGLGPCRSPSSPSSHSLHMKTPVFFCAALSCATACVEQSGRSQVAHLATEAWPQGFFLNRPDSTVQGSFMYRSVQSCRAHRPAGGRRDAPPPWCRKSRRLRAPGWYCRLPASRRRRPGVFLADDHWMTRGLRSAAFGMVLESVFAPQQLRPRRQRAGAQAADHDLELRAGQRRAACRRASRSCATNSLRSAASYCAGNALPRQQDLDLVDLAAVAHVERELEALAAGGDAFLGHQLSWPFAPEKQ